MDDVNEIMKEGTKETVRRMLNKVVASESLTAAVEYKIASELCEAIKTTGSTLLSASAVLRESVDESIKVLTNSIDDFRKSNEKTSNRLVWLTGVIGFSAIVQVVYIAMLLFKK